MISRGRAVASSAWCSTSTCASMWPRLISRGRGQLRQSTASVAVWLQCGRGCFAAEGAELAFGENVDRKSGFNVAADVSPRKASVLPRDQSRQFGGFNVAADDSPRKGLRQLRHAQMVRRASMWPRMFRRGRGRDPWSPIAPASSASMWPRLFRRGRRCDADRRSGRGIAASMWPRMIRRGRDRGHVASARDRIWLQCGRGCFAAEGTSPSQLLDRTCIACFNVAADVSPRKARHLCRCSQSWQLQLQCGRGCFAAEGRDLTHVDAIV